MLGALTLTPGARNHTWRRWVVWGVLLVGLAVLGVWTLLTRLAIYAVASQVHLTVDPAIQFLVTPVAGQVSGTHLQVGRAVQAGEVLVELDSTEQHLRAEEERQRLLGLQAHRTARQQEGSALEAASRAVRQEAQAAIEEARTRQHDAGVALQGAQEKTQRLGPFAPLTALPPQQAVVDTARLALQRLEREQQVRAAEWHLRLAQFQREVVVLDGDIALATARLARLEHVLALRQLRAPVAGRLGAVLHLPVGTFVHEGERLGVIGSAAAPLVTATVAPVLPGRPVRPGQPAWLRHTEGPAGTSQSLGAHVLHTDAVGQEERQRVVLRLTPEALAHWPLQPGVVWTAVVEVERVDPLTLALRVLGQCLWGYTRLSRPAVLPGETR